MPVAVITFREWKSGVRPASDTVAVMSRADGYGRALSPFMLGPCRMWNGSLSGNVENAWQYSKVYREHLEADGSVGDRWLEWATSGWHNDRAVRYPMGKGVSPLFSVWGDVRLAYIEARKAIYVPLYAGEVYRSPAWQTLKEKHASVTGEGREMFLVDFDAYSHRSMGMTYRDVVENPSKPMGHAFVLAMMLEDQETLASVISEGMELRRKGVMQSAAPIV